MSAPEKPAEPVPGAPAATIKALAERIYVELVGRVMLTAGESKPNPVDLAKYCYKLAEAFDSIEAEAKKVAAAKTAKYDVKIDDMTSWKK